MINTPTIKEYILDPVKVSLIRDAIQSGVTQYKMQTFDQALASMVQNKLVLAETAIQVASRPNEFALHLQGIQGAADRVWGGIQMDAIDSPLPEEPNWVQRKAA